MLILQFLTLLDARLTARLARSSASLDVVVVLDLEDALWDVDDVRRTAALKAQGRRDLVTLATEHAALFDGQRLGVRLNRASSPEAVLDIEALAAASDVVAFDTIVVPKVEGADEVPEWADRLDAPGIRYRRIVPIVETRTGIADLESILAGCRRAGVEWIVYGHYDFALDAGWWPVPDHDDDAFWAHVEPLIATIESAGLGYVHPPFFGIDDIARFEAILGRLSRTCRREFGVLTIGGPQTMWAAERRRATGVHGAARRRRSELVDPEERARRIVGTFAGDRRSGTSWVVDPETHEFLSPHLYLAAQAYLSRAVDPASRTDA